MLALKSVRCALVGVIATVLSAVAAGLLWIALYGDAIQIASTDDAIAIGTASMLVVLITQVLICCFCQRNLMPQASVFVLRLITVISSILVGLKGAVACIVFLLPWDAEVRSRDEVCSSVRSGSSYVLIRESIETMSGGVYYIRLVQRFALLGIDFDVRLFRNKGSWDNLTACNIVVGLNVVQLRVVNGSGNAYRFEIEKS